MDRSKYKIGDSLSNAPNIYIRGITTLSNGKKRYFLQNNDNTGQNFEVASKCLLTSAFRTFVFDEDELDNLITIVSDIK